MKFLTGLLSCLLALIGCDTRPSMTSITRASEGRVDTLFSKTTQVDGVTTFECYTSRSGGCHYRVYEERCEEGSACRQEVLDAFVLQAGARHQVKGLQAGFRHCVSEHAAAACG